MALTLEQQQTELQNAYEACLAAMNGTLTGNMASYRLPDGREVRSLSMPDLVVAANWLKAEIDNVERQIAKAAGGGNLNRVKMRLP